MKEGLRLKTKVKIGNPIDISKLEEADVIIDTGASFSVIRESRLQRLNIKPLYKKRLRLANGEIIERDAGIAYFKIEGKGEGGSDVIFGEEGDTELLGLLTLLVNTKTGELYRT